MPQEKGNPKRVLIICGATATGKTAYAIRLALERNTHIISCDSRQCYREMNIGVAKPSAEELALVPHYFINSHSIFDDVNAAVFEQYALSRCDKLFQEHQDIIMVGGTGLYIKAFTDGIDRIPDIEAPIRLNILADYSKNGLPWLQQAVQREDPEYYAAGEIQNPQRLMRALEVVRGTGRSIRSFQTGKKVQRPFQVQKIGLDVPKEVLHQRINHRVDLMMEAGLLREVESLFVYRHLPALRTVGYTELFDYLEGKWSLPEAVDRIKINTRQYAKRQLTWFRRDPAIQWITPQ